MGPRPKNKVAKPEDLRCATGRKSKDLYQTQDARHQTPDARQKTVLICVICG